MQVFALACLYLGFFLSSVLASPLLSSRGISSSLYDDLVRYTQYSSAAYQLLCPSPLGNTLVQSFSEGRHGFIARDDTRKEIVVSFRGSFSLADAATGPRFKPIIILRSSTPLTDLDILLVPFISPGVTKTFNVHSGFLAAYNEVAEAILVTVNGQLAKYPKYSVVVTGHSLGGALAALGASALKTALPTTAMKLYTFGQPRTGDAQFAAYVESTIGAGSIFRAVHTFGKRFSQYGTLFLLDILADGVPTMLPRFLGYEHHSTEYWQFKDPGLFTSKASTVTKCVGEEDPACSASILSTGINPPHLFYFGQIMAVDPLLCI
ncbi:alpha/beta-hydrolase [Mycena metata]|uniref:Alpha/beta-hydrolase n=1 Tax=Mycena metata TaxID=1033252 RepID=A0AAD7MQ16_9AGAR|nr:alpha/beta-hydrolase [Mycena metata]